MHSQPTIPDPLRAPQPIPEGLAPVAIVTGAGSGIGRATCELLSARGYRLVLVGRRIARLQHTGYTLKSEWAAISADVADPQQIRRTMESALARFGRIDALVNNAGFAPMAAIEHHTPELIQRVFAVNAIGPALAVAAVWPTMLAQGSGQIVNVSSFATIDPFPGFFAYAAAKAAVNLLALSASNEGRSHGVRAFAVAPGAVETEMLRSIASVEAIPPDRALSARAVAEVIVACATGERDDETGRTILVPSP